MSIAFMLGASTGALLLGGGVLAAGLKVLASKSILVAEIQEGTGISVMRGQSLDDIYISRRGYHVNHPKWRDKEDPRYEHNCPAWEIIPDKPGVKYDDRPWLLRILGIHWIGFLRSIYEYTFSWNEMETDPGTGKKKVRPRIREKTKFAYVVPFSYVQVVDAAETADQLPMDGMYQLLVELTNLEKALHGNVDWLEVTGGYANRAAKNYMGSRTIAQLLSETDEEENPADPSANDSFSAPLIRMTDHLPDEPRSRGRKKSQGLRGRYGVAIRAGNFETIAPPGHIAEEVNAALMRNYVSEQDAKAIRNTGQAEADAILAKGRAENTVVSERGKSDAKALLFRLAILRKDRDLGKILLQTDAMRSPGSGEKIIWANNPFLRKSGIAEIADEFGLSPEELGGMIREMKVEHEKQKENA